jgi:S-adenosylmethionine synthetase
MGKEHYVADKTFNKGHKNELTLKVLNSLHGKN